MIKVGDRVKCADNYESSLPGLIYGKIYTIKHIGFNGYLDLNEMPSHNQGFMQKRFILIENKKLDETEWLDAVQQNFKKGF